MVTLGLSEPSPNVECDESWSAHKALVWESGDPGSSLAQALIHCLIWVKAHPLLGPQSVRLSV